MLGRWTAGCIIELRYEYSLSPLLNSNVESLGLSKNIMKNSGEEIVSTQMTFLASCAHWEVLARDSIESRIPEFKTETGIFAHNKNARNGRGDLWCGKLRLLAKASAVGISEKKVGRETKWRHEPRTILQSHNDLPQSQPKRRKSAQYMERVCIDRSFVKSTSQ